MVDSPAQVHFTMSWSCGLVVEAVRCAFVSMATCPKLLPGPIFSTYLMRTTKNFTIWLTYYYMTEPVRNTYKYCWYVMLFWIIPYISLSHLFKSLSFTAPISHCLIYLSPICSVLYSPPRCIIMPAVSKYHPWNTIPHWLSANKSHIVPLSLKQEGVRYHHH